MVKSVIRKTLMEWKTYQMPEEVAEEGDTKRSQKRGKKGAKKRNCWPKIKQKGWQRWQMSYENESQGNRAHT